MTDQLDRLKAGLADRYKLERQLGAGGMATVYLAEDLKHKRKVAVKVLRPELAAVLGAVPRQIVDAGEQLYILTDTRLYVLSGDSLEALVDVYESCSRCCVKIQHKRHPSS